MPYIPKIHPKIYKEIANSMLEPMFNTLEDLEIYPNPNTVQSMLYAKIYPMKIELERNVRQQFNYEAD